MMAYQASSLIAWFPQADRDEMIQETANMEGDRDRAEQTIPIHDRVCHDCTRRRIDSSLAAE
jgi:hypothetical protein